MIALLANVFQNCGYDFKTLYLRTTEIDVCDIEGLFWDMVKDSACVNFGVRMSKKTSVKFSQHLCCKALPSHPGTFT